MAFVTEPLPTLCDWPVDRSCYPAVEGDLDMAKQRYAEELAVQVLWSLSGRQFGVCPVVLRPCSQLSYVSRYGGQDFPWYPLWDGGAWRNVTCGCIGQCDWRAPTVVHLSTTTGLPIQEVLEVKVGATVLDESAYVLEGDLLYRTGGIAWPSQDLSKPLGSEGTWSVTYTRGNPVPAGVGVFVGLLAKEFMNACNGGKCRLSRRVQSVVRQGVSTEMMNPSAVYADGRTGLDEIDIWIKAVNPHTLAQPPKVR